MSGLEGVSATLAARRLGMILRARRVRFGTLRVADVAKAAAVSQPTWSQVETGTAVPSQRHLEGALRVLEIEGPEAKALLALRERAKRKEWWQDYDDVASAMYLKLVGFETSAIRIQNCSSGWIPGLLQTPAAARAIIGVPGNIRPEDVDRMVDLRMTRQRILANSGLQYHAICGEEALRYRVGGPAILLEQLRHLLDVISSHSNVTFQVAPYSAGVHLGHVNPYTILHFENDVDSPLLHFEYGLTSSTADSPNELRRWAYVFGELEGMALTPAKTTDLINSVIKELST